MKNKEKALLRSLAKDGESFEEIRRYVDCADATIRSYIKQFKPTKLKMVKICPVDWDRNN